MRDSDKYLHLFLQIIYFYLAQNKEMFLRHTRRASTREIEFPSQLIWRSKDLFSEKRNTSIAIEIGQRGCLNHCSLYGSIDLAIDPAKVFMLLAINKTLTFKWYTALNFRFWFGKNACSPQCADLLFKKNLNFLLPFKFYTAVNLWNLPLII